MFSVLKKNLFLKLVSLFLALILWVIITRGTGGSEMEISLGIPLVLHNLPTDLEVVADPVERVDVRFSGPRRFVSRISQLGITIPLDLSGAMEGETTFELYTADLDVPERTTVTRISPSSISIVLEKTLNRELLVEPVVQGKPAEGFTAGPPVAVPKTVELKGPRSAISGLRKVSTAPLQITDAVEAVSAQVPLLMPDPKIHPVEKSTVMVTVPVTRANVIKEGKKGS